MPMISPVRQLRQNVMAAAAAEFPGNEVSVVAGKLHHAANENSGIPVLAVYPDVEAEDAIVITQDTAVFVQFFLSWSRTERDQTVDPTTLEDYAHRLRLRLQTYAVAPGTTENWTLRLQEVRYDDDPSGNRTRFTARVISMGQNLAETTA